VVVKRNTNLKKKYREFVPLQRKVFEILNNIGNKIGLSIRNIKKERLSVSDQNIDIDYAGLAANTLRLLAVDGVQKAIRDIRNAYGEWRMWPLCYGVDT
jgi:hypothetical protein